MSFNRSKKVELFSEFNDTMQSIPKFTGSISNLGSPATNINYKPIIPNSKQKQFLNKHKLSNSMNTSMVSNQSLNHLDPKF